MKITTGKDELRRALAACQISRTGARGVRTGLSGLDDVCPHGLFQGGAVHELLSPPRSTLPQSISLLIARAAQTNGSRRGAIAWSDPQRELYLPALSAAGIDLRHLMLLRCTNRADQLWALAQCLGCRGVSATVAFISRLSQAEARRLQLAAERGGGVGVFMRPHTPGERAPYAAATRWHVVPAPGGQDVQRWRMELLHGHGGRLGKVLLLEVDRETRIVRAPLPLADRPLAAPPARATA